MIPGAVLARPGARRLGLVVAGLLALAAPAPALAAGVLHLNWDECGPTGAANKAFACQTNDGQHALYCAFTLAQPVGDVIAVEMVVDLQHASPSLPSWWQLGSGGCRSGALTASGAPPSGGDCTDFWQGEATARIQGYAVGEPRGGANQARIKVALAVLSGDPRSLLGSVLYYAGQIRISNAATVGPSACPGCLEPACLVLNSIWVGRLLGSPGGDVFVQDPGPGNGNLATWQGGTGASCAAVPVRARTWGAIKALYR